MADAPRSFSIYEIIILLTWYYVPVHGKCSDQVFPNIHEDNSSPRVYIVPSCRKKRILTLNLTDASEWCIFLIVLGFPPTMYRIILLSVQHKSYVL